VKANHSTKRLIYIVNRISADDAQHYVHIPPLLSELERLGWVVDLVGERGGSGNAEVLGRRVTYLSRSSKLLRLVRLVAHLLAVRRRGGHLVFVRISKFAALTSALLGRVLGWKTVYWLSGTVEDFNLKRGWRGRVGLAGMRVLLTLVDRLATGPEAMASYYSIQYGLPASKILMLYNDIDLDGRAVSRTAAERASKVLLVHRLSPVRETDRYFPMLLDALGRYSRKAGIPVTLHICGDGPERPLLERLAQEAPAEVLVEFHGAIPQVKLAAFYEAADLFVMPSYREGFPRVMLEAMAHGLPIVATDAGGTRDLCGAAQRKYVVDRDDAECFGSAVESLLSSAADRRLIIRENLMTVQRFATPRIARMYDERLSELIGVHSAS
jgi:glycosyltransferase involved in cell wall biosynthesis